MLFGLDGVEIGLIIVFLCLFGGILSGFPVAFAIGGAGIISFGIIAALDSAGLLLHQAIDTGSAMYADLVAQGVRPESISTFRYPDLPRYSEPVFPRGWEVALDRNISFVVNRMNERVLAGQSIETLLAVAMFVLMGIPLERSRIANDLLTTMARVFGPLPGGLADAIADSTPTSRTPSRSPRRSPSPTTRAPTALLPSPTSWRRRSTGSGPTTSTKKDGGER